MSTHFRRLLTALLIVMALVTMLPGQALAGGSIGPRQMMIFYYDAINSGNYALAYQQWVNPPQTYAQFVAGYADTVSVNMYFGGFQAAGPGRLDGRMPSILVGTHSDGSQVAYSGCYDLRYNGGGTGISQWSVLGGSFTPMAFIPAYGARDDGGIGDLLGGINCLDRYNPDGSYQFAQGMLIDYFDAINRGKFQQAYSYWANPQQNFQDFANGWMTTVETVAFYGNYQASGSLNTAEGGRVPVMLMGYHTDGSLVAYQGCIGVNYNIAATPHWRIWNAYLSPVAFAATPTAAQVTAALSASCY
jgi:hypothetical protein